MAEAYFLKLANGTLAPATDEDGELLKKIKLGEAVRLKFTRQRNYQYLRKFFALINFAFDYWEPPEVIDNKWNVIPEKNIERFRKDVTILAGYYTCTHRVDGTVRVEAKSVSFANMSEDEFERLYSSVIDVVLKHVCTQYDGQMLRDVVDQTMAFT